ncbi:helix-turn-helix transcriptional regulator [Vibrio parahaemolyticus]|nr:helix-turn-helix transcriptional regulator [Vibrio parahaemolyticus]
MKSLHLAKTIDVIRSNVVANKSTENNEHRNKRYFKQGNDIFLLRILIGVTQQELSNSIGISKETIRNAERENRYLSIKLSNRLEEFVSKRPNASNIITTIKRTNSNDWLKWLESNIGKKPRVTSISCSKCGTDNISFTTARGTCKLIKLTCEHCGHERYSSNIQLFRVQKWLTCDQINPYDTELFQADHSKQESFEITYLNGIPVIFHRSALICLRVKSGLSIREMAIKSQLSPDILKRCENGTRKIDKQITEKLYKAMQRHNNLFLNYRKIIQLDKEVLNKALFNTENSKPKDGRAIKHSIIKLFGEQNET